MNDIQIKKTVLMVGYTYYEIDPRVIREAEAALAGGFDVDVLALGKPGSPGIEMVRGVRLIRLNQAKYRGAGHLRYVLEYLKFVFRCLLKITWLHWSRKYSLVHINNMPDFLVFSAIIPRAFGAKVILDIHDPMPDTFESKFQKSKRKRLYYWLLLLQERLSIAFCNKTITVHHPVRDGILLKHGIPPKSLDVIGNFADDELFRLRTSYNIAQGVKFVFHGTILERSGLRLLMNALAEVRRKDKIKVKIIGEGDFSPTLKEMVESLNLSGMVEFDNHSYPVHSIPSLIEDCNVGLVPLEISSVTNYALPLKLLEYISMGLPVVSVRSAAICYYFGEEDCIFFDWDNPSSLSTVLDRIAEDPKILLRYRERALAIRERFSWKGEKEKYIALLYELTGASAVAALANSAY